jgi:hypothetical protein
MKALLLSSLLCLVACLGGQSKQTKQESARAGDRSGDLPTATRAETDWKKAAQGHGAAGVVPAEDLAAMDKESAPGAKLAGDAGH